MIMIKKGDLKNDLFLTVDSVKWGSFGVDQQGKFSNTLAWDSAFYKPTKRQ
jgi:hypothetical protein